ncbi:hypothetical protein BH10PSE19_BH10PSE19_22810 [soil metagenome]
MNNFKMAIAAILLTSLTPIVSNAAKFLIQDIEEGPLSLQFRYVDGQLEYFRIENTTDVPIRIELLGNNYVLGKKDHMDFDPPKLDIIHVGYGIYNDYPTLVNGLLPARFNKTTIFQLPTKNNDTTGAIVRQKH